MPDNATDAEIQPMLEGHASDVADAPKSERRLPWVKPVIFIALWYFFSTVLNVFNKQLFGKKRGIFGQGFPAPIMLTSIQFLLQFVLAKLVLNLNIGPARTPRKKPRTWSDYFKHVVPNGVATGSDIGLSNLSYQTITLSFYVMCKSTTPLYLLLFTILWRIERPSWSLAGVMATISCGLLLLVYGETSFNLYGFSLVMTAACMSGLRWTLTQILLQGHATSESEGGPLEVIEQLTPVMFLSAFSLSLMMENLADLISSAYFETKEHAAVTLFLMSVSAVLAFSMVLSEYTVIKETSALTFMVAGTCKELITVLAAVIFFHDHFGPVNGLGLVILISGVCFYNYYKYIKLQEGETKVPNANNVLRKNRSDSLELQPQKPSSPVINDSQAYIRPANNSH